jgi:hypothetical protein
VQCEFSAVNYNASNGICEIWICALEIIGNVIEISTVGTFGGSCGSCCADKAAIS